MEANLFLYSLVAEHDLSSRDREPIISRQTALLSGDREAPITGGSPQRKE